MDKPVVHYVGEALSFGGHAILQPVDHPNHIPGHAVSNTKEVWTSSVLLWDKTTGHIETANTIYKPLEKPNA